MGRDSVIHRRALFGILTGAAAYALAPEPVKKYFFAPAGGWRKVQQRLGRNGQPIGWRVYGVVPGRGHLLLGEFMADEGVRLKPGTLVDFPTIRITNGTAVAY